MRMLEYERSILYSKRRKLNRNFFYEYRGLIMSRLVRCVDCVNKKKCKNVRVNKHKKIECDKYVSDLNKMYNKNKGK